MKQYKKLRYDELYMDIAYRVSEMSHCKRLNVGAICVKDDRIISMGWNGMPSGFDNTCEIDDRTKEEVLHAEQNLLMKLARSNESCENSTIYITHAPCVTCAKLLIQAKPEIIYYSEKYRDTSGISLISLAGIPIYQLNINNISNS